MLADIKMVMPAASGFILGNMDSRPIRIKIAPLLALITSSMSDPRPSVKYCPDSA